MAMMTSYCWFQAHNRKLNLNTAEAAIHQMVRLVEVEPRTSLRATRSR